MSRLAVERSGQPPRDDQGAWSDFLSMALAYQELGQSDDGRQSLAKIESLDQQPGSRPTLTWDARHELTLLRREAEALMHYDPIFPADPFAR